MDGVRRIRAEFHLDAVSLSWLQDLVQVNEPADELGERLSMAGFEVEELDDLSSLAQGVVVGHVLEREKHPMPTS